MTDAAAAPDYAEIVRRLRSGTIVPFFGAGASIGCGLPSGRDLARRLMAVAGIPDFENSDDLALIASYVVQARDSLALQDELRAALGVDAKPGRIHRLLAGFEAVRLYVTTNYDGLIEEALAPRAPWVVVDRGTPGVVACRPPGGYWREVESKNLGTEYRDSTQPIVLKLHGTFDVQNRDNDSFLITENDYADFLGRGEGDQIPAMLASIMRTRSFLFLGYALKDWNVRVLLRKLAATRRMAKISSWAVVLQPGWVESELWRAQNVDMHDLDLDVFAAGLEEAMRAPA